MAKRNDTTAGPAHNGGPPLDVGTVDDAAVYLNISRNSAYEAIKRNEIPHVRIGKKIVVSMIRLRRMVRGEAA